ncbi:MAG: phospholipid scramblase-related protein, partial [Myxococcota bacterium]
RIVKDGANVGAIKKQWGGLMKDAFTDADTFGLELGPGMDPQLRSLALAATFLVDFLYFEDSGD